ncbi:MAG: hypothetical protein U0X76_00055 [Bacteroidia bacterium]
MKRMLLPTKRHILIIGVFYMMLMFFGIGVNHITVSLGNCNATPDSISFDYFILHDGTSTATTMLYSAAAFRLNYPSTIYTVPFGISYVTGTCDPNISANFAVQSASGFNVAVNTVTHLLSLTMGSGAQLPAANAPAVAKNGPPIKIGRFRITPTTATKFPLGATVAITFATSGNGGTFYIDGGPTVTGLNLAANVTLGSVCSPVVTGTACNLTASIQSFVDVTCNGANNGTATATFAGTPTGTVSYSWNTVPAQTGATATGLSAGYIYCNCNRSGVFAQQQQP